MHPAKRRFIIFFCLYTIQIIVQRIFRFFIWYYSTQLPKYYFEVENVLEGRLPPLHPPHYDHENRQMPSSGNISCVSLCLTTV